MGGQGDDERSALDIHVYIHSESSQKLDKIQATLNKLLQKENITMADLSALQAEVASNTTIEESAVALIQGLAAQIAAAANDPAAIQDIVNTLQANDSALAAAVAANTATPTAADAAGGVVGGTPVTADAAAANAEADAVNAANAAAAQAAQDAAATTATPDPGAAAPSDGGTVTADPAAPADTSVPADQAAPAAQDGAPA